jgi:hypothetical protein
MTDVVNNDDAPDTTPGGTDDYVVEEVWEELSDDNGEIIEFKQGTEKQGYFVHLVTLDLPEERRENGQETADLLVFEESKGDIITRWAAWSNYSLRKIDFVQDEYYSVKCIGARKAAQGEMKVFSVRHRTTVKLDRF